MKGLCLLAFVAVLAGPSAPASAQQGAGSRLTFTDSIGRPAIFNVLFPDAPELEPAPIDAATLASEFARLCLATDFDPALLQAAAPRSSFGLAFLHLRYLGDRRTPPFDIDGWQGRSASVRIWNGDERAFRRLPFIVVESRVEIIGSAGYGTIRTFSPQCNIDVASTSLGDWSALLAALTEVIGRPPTSARSGRRWGQATWEPPAGSGNREVIGVRLDGMTRPGQTLHLGIVRPAGAQ